MGEEIAVSAVEGRHGVNGHRDFGLEDPLDEGVPVGATQNLLHAAEAVDHAGDPCVSHPEEGQAVLDGP